jgi:predicted O-methyltransferase YrrM
MPSWLKRILESYARPGQTAIAMEAKSHVQKTVGCVKELLRENELDLLFIDGDHSYEGVKQDFLSYSPLVRKGGWIAFHDIIPDRQTSYGICTESWTGDVPKFYNQIKRHWNHFEIVENPNQNGWGIGVLIWE